MRARALWLSVALTACSKASTPDPAAIHASGGVEGAAFGGTPAIARVELRLRTDGGKERTLSSAPASEGAILVPDTSPDSVGALALAGLSTDGALLTYGRTPALELAGLALSTVPITVFVSRVGTLARAVRVPHPAQTPRGALLGSRYLVVGDATTTTLEVIDLLDLLPSEEVKALDVAPVMLAVAGGALLSIDASGAASIAQAGSSVRTVPSPPSGSRFADVLGGTTIVGDDGAAYLVGATRASGETDLVLRFASDGTVTARHLARARSGASAAWVVGRGLVVVGGASSSASRTPSVELLAASASAFSPLPFAEDGTAGALLLPLDDHRVLRVRADGSVETLDLACPTACAPIALPLKLDAITPRADDAALPLERGGAVLVRSGHVLRLDAALATSSLLIDSASPVAITALGTGAIAIAIGGDDVMRTTQ